MSLEPKLQQLAASDRVEYGDVFSVNARPRKEFSGADNELAHMLSRRLIINGEDQEDNTTIDEDRHETEDKTTTQANVLTQRFQVEENPQNKVHKLPRSYSMTVPLPHADTRVNHSDVCVKQTAVAVRYTEQSSYKQLQEKYFFDSTFKDEMLQKDYALQEARTEVESGRTAKQFELDELRRQKEELLVKKEDLDRQIKQYEADSRTSKKVISQLNQRKKQLKDNLKRQQDENKNATAIIQQLKIDLKKQKDLYKLQEEKFTTTIQRLEINLQGQIEDNNQTFTTAIQELEAKLQHRDYQLQKLKAEVNDELSPYILHQIPDLGECKGAGSYGSVHSIQLNGISCIAKRIHDILLGQGREEGVNLEDKRAAYSKFYSECVLLSQIRHPNIVQFMGVYYGPHRDYGRELTLVMERLYMNLEECLKRYQNIEMWLKVSILLDISQGLLHLHSQSVVHRDLTAPNILLTTSFHAKIADLGVSKILDVHPLAASKQSMNPGTLGYMPPEALDDNPEYGSALDVFSFGVLMLFVLLQKYPQYSEVGLTVTSVQRKEIQIQKRMKWIAKIPQEHPTRKLICLCLQDEPERRPTTNNLNSTLITFAQQCTKPFVDTIEMQRKLKPTTLPA